MRILNSKHLHPALKRNLIKRKHINITRNSINLINVDIFFAKFPNRSLSAASEVFCSCSVKSVWNNPGSLFHASQRRWYVEYNGMQHLLTYCRHKLMFLFFKGLFMHFKTVIADLQISKSPIGPTKKSGEAL